MDWGCSGQVGAARGTNPALQEEIDRVPAEMRQGRKRPNRVRAGGASDQGPDQRIEQGGTGLACGTLDLPQPEVVVGHHRQPLLRDSADHVGQ